MIMVTLIGSHHLVAAITFIIMVIIGIIIISQNVHMSTNLTKNFELFEKSLNFHTLRS